jgi:hypothetical protein
MAKKPTTANKRNATAKPARSAKSTNKRAAAKAARAPRGRAAKSPACKAARPARAARGKQGQFRETVDGCVSTLNDWRKDCVASLRKIIRTAAPRFSSLKEAGKKELHELVRLAGRLHEAKASPKRRPARKLKTK